jgi:hypothetical protein
VTLTFSDVPLPHSKYGGSAYESGRKLVVDGIRLAHIMWDCDELLWDWVMSGSELLRGFRHAARGRFGHTETVRLKPGVFELVWGMHHESLRLGLDPHMRIMTNGYPWRLYELSQHIPGFVELIGAPAQDDRYSGWRGHSRVFTRWDYATIAESALFHARHGTSLFERASNREILERHFQKRPFSSSFKLPELAQAVGKTGFDDIRILVDDHFTNIKRFAASGRVGVHAVVPGTPQKGRIPNTTFGPKNAYLDGMSGDIVGALAQALLEASKAPDGAILRPKSQPMSSAEALQFEIVVPWDRIGPEWVEPLRRIKRQYS